jgi:predicted nucleic acid-binding Zn ribbon protein
MEPLAKRLVELIENEGQLRPVIEILGVEQTECGEHVLRWNVRPRPDTLGRPPNPSRLTALDDLLLLTEASDAASSAELVLEIARRYGPLRLCEHDLPFTHHPDCRANREERVSAWLAWAEVFAAARAGLRLPASAAERLGLTDDVGQRREPWSLRALDLLRWLAAGYGYRAADPRNELYDVGLFFELVRKVEAAQERHCGVCKASLEGLHGNRRYCDRCQEARKKHKGRKRHALEWADANLLKLLLKHGNADRIRELLKGCSTRHIGELKRSLTQSEQRKLSGALRGRADEHQG